MKNKFDIIQNLLKEKQINTTSQRKEIIQIFLNNKGHFKPEEIHTLVKNKKIGLATVYRTIEILKTNDIIEEICIGKDRYYELKLFSEKRLHIHFQCDQCHKIYDYDKTNVILDLIHLRNLVEDEYKVEVSDLKMMLNGTCQDCREGDECLDQQS